MAPHSSTLPWKIPWTEEPGGLQSMGSLGVWTRLSDFIFTFMHWRRKWQPTPVFLPGESRGQRSLVGCRLWGRTGSNTTGTTQQQRLLLTVPVNSVGQMWAAPWSPRSGDAPEKVMAAHSIVLAWRTAWTEEEPGGVRKSWTGL